MNRLKALYRGWAIPCAGTQVYAPHYRSEWLSKIREAGVRRRAELYYQQLDALRLVRQQARKELLAEAREQDRKRTRLNSSHANISYAVFCLDKKKDALDESRGD